MNSSMSFSFAVKDGSDSFSECWGEESCYPNTVRDLCFKISDSQDFIVGFLSNS